MAKYIDRDQLIDWLKTEIKFKDLSDGLGICLVIMKEDFERAIKHMPDSIIKDVAPVRHGRWITKKVATGKEYTICSACDFAVYYTMAGGLTPLDIRNAKYCPNCGARMDAPSNLAEPEDAERNRRIESLLKKGTTGNGQT